MLQEDNESLCEPKIEVDEDELLDLSNDEEDQNIGLELKKKSMNANNKPCRIIKTNTTNNEPPSSSAKLPPAPMLVTTADNSDGDSDSDLDCDLDQLSRINRSTGTIKDTGPTELTLSDDDDDEGVETSPSPAQPTRSLSYGLRKRSSVNYSSFLGSSDEENEPKTKKEKVQPFKKTMLDIFSLSASQLTKYLKDPTLVEDFTKWSIDLRKRRLLPDSRWELMKNFFKKYGTTVDHFFYSMTSSKINEVTHEPHTEDTANFTADLEIILNYATHLTKLKIRYNNVTKSQKEGISCCSSTLKVVHKCIQAGNLQSLRSLTLLSLFGEDSIRKQEFDILLKLEVKLVNLELGDSLWEDISPESFEEFLNKHKNTLESLTIQGGFKGNTNLSRFIIKFPKMEKLKSLSICPTYGFVSEIKNPNSKKAREIRLDKEAKPQPFRFAIQFPYDVPKLEKLILGNLVDVEELPFSILRRLKVFKCGSYWNLSVKFPPESSRQSRYGSLVTELQLPDGLKDPTFLPKIEKYFPNIKKVWIFLPSVSVLRSFFKNMENSSLEELYLKTQFDFGSTLESCLLPDDRDALKKSDLTKTQVETLKEYKHFADYVKYYNIQLPLEADDLMEGNSAGIRSLKSLKVLELYHIPRILLLPNPEEERKWFDHNCKFLSTEIGYLKYPYSGKCHQEILKMDLQKYTWNNLLISTKATDALTMAGYVNLNQDEINDSSDEDLFTAINISGVHKPIKMAIQPSMLLPDYFKNKEEN